MKFTSAFATRTLAVAITLALWLPGPAAAAGAVIQSQAVEMGIPGNMAGAAGMAAVPRSLGSAALQTNLDLSHQSLPSFSPAPVIKTNEASAVLPQAPVLTPSVVGTLSGQQGADVSLPQAADAAQDETAMFKSGAAADAGSVQTQAPAITAQPGRFAKAAQRMSRSSRSAAKALSSSQEESKAAEIAAADIPAADFGGPGPWKKVQDLGRQVANQLELPEGIPQGWIHQLGRMERSMGPAESRLHDIVQRTGFRAAALNKEILDHHNDKYTTQLSRGPITNQNQSGRCWIFAGLNMIRSALIAEKRVAKDFEFSENYLHFFNMLEKCNRNLEAATEVLLARSVGVDIPKNVLLARLATGIGDGGWGEWFQFLVSKYGLVPRGAMTETPSSMSTSFLTKELENTLAASIQELVEKTYGLKPVAAANEALQIRGNALSRIWMILSTHLGTPPASFEYRNDAKKGRKQGLAQVNPAKIERYTPQQFAKEFVKFDPADYVSVTNFPGKKKNGVFTIDHSAIGAARAGQDKFDIRFLNVGEQRLEELVIASIKGGQPAYFLADISEDVDYNSGIMHPKIYERAPVYGFAKDEHERLSRTAATRLGVIGPNHAMAITGFDRPDPNKPVVKYQVENSWSDEVGSKGIFHMYREWMHRNVYGVLVHKKFLTPAERNIWKGQAKVIDANDMI